jgi:hypothetical protein
MVSEKEESPVELRDRILGPKISYRVEEVIKSGALGGETAVRADIKSGKIPVVRSGPRTVRVLGTDFARLIAERRSGGAS